MSCANSEKNIMELIHNKTDLGKKEEEDRKIAREIRKIQVISEVKEAVFEAINIVPDKRFAKLEEKEPTEIETEASLYGTDFSTSCIIYALKKVENEENDKEDAKFHIHLIWDNNKEIILITITNKHTEEGDI